MTATGVVGNTWGMADPPERPALSQARFDAFYDEHI
jgi:hypothetical protein